MKNENLHPKIAEDATLGWATLGWATLRLVLAFITLLGATITLRAQQAAEPASKESAPDRTAVPVINPGILVKKVPPKYPKQARKQHIEGTVVLRATITKDGTISDLQLVSGHPMLAQAALDAVKKWKYRPYLKDGQAVEVETTITVNFALSR